MGCELVTGRYDEVHRPNRFEIVNWLGMRLIVVALFAPNLIWAQEEVSQQVWTNFIMAFPQSDKLYYELDAETAHQISGGEPWRYIYGTGMVEYYPSKLFDLTGELVVGVTDQDRLEDSFEVSTRWGFRTHFLNTIIDKYNRWEQFPSRKIGLANLMRLEQRNFWYTSSRPSSHDWRWRNRVELRVAINKPDMATDGVWYLMADWEWFVPMSGQTSERFSTKFRKRYGGGYRWRYKWRFELLFQIDDARDTLADDFDVEAYMVDLRAKMFF